jgi:hypothetical protein
VYSVYSENLLLQPALIICHNYLHQRTCR